MLQHTECGTISDHAGSRCHYFGGGCENMGGNMELTKQTDGKSEICIAFTIKTIKLV